MDMTTFAERLQFLRDRYAIMMGLLLLLVGAGLAAAPLLAWVAGAILLGLTINKLLPVRS